MNKFRSIYRRVISWILYRVIGKPVEAARFLGVSIGNQCLILDDPWKVFGSEPYLITIGDHVEITNGVRFSTHDGAIWVKRGMNGYENTDIFGKIIISDNVFIGINSIVLPGTIIENDVIVGAGSLVKGTVKAQSVYAGIPARRINSLDIYFETVKPLLRSTHNLNYDEKRKYLIEEMNI